MGAAGRLLLEVAPAESEQQPILVHPAWAPRPEAVTLSPRWMPTPWEPPCPDPGYLNISEEEERFEAQELGSGEKEVLSNGTQMDSQKARQSWLKAVISQSQAKEFNKADGSLRSWGPPA